MTWPHGDPDTVVRSVLADPAYRAATATSAARPQESLLIVALRWIVDHLRPLLRPLAHAAAATQGIGTAVGFALVVLALGGLAFVVFRLALAFARVPLARNRRDAAIDALDVERSGPEWRALARDAAARGEFARAIAALFNAALAELDVRAVVAFDATRTPGEYRRLVRRARSRASAPFDELADRFVRAVYAPEHPERSEYEAAERALAALEPALAP